ncbi:MAG: pyruvate:ferredoxin (flavodoxin) oxidoreductase [Anaerolineales bacterium]|jgi:pyruvate-ferredoxin/flavodoxin oxidoreductase
MAANKSKRKFVPYDGNAAAAHVAYATNEVIAIYPITPSSPMGEIADEKAASGQPNIYGTVPNVVEMQAEGGAAGAVHGALTTGALTTTFTASQGLLLMLPNMFKIAGELTPAVFHIAARSVAAQALSIFADHSDVMAARSTGWGQLFGNNPQEVMDLALIAQASALEARVPFLNIFDGFRTSHEIQMVEELTYDDIAAMIDEQWVIDHRKRGLTPDHPSIRGTAQNPDVFFAARETVNPYYLKTPGIVKAAMERFAKITGREYHLFDYEGAPDAEHVIVIMASGGDTVHEVVNYLNANGGKVGVIKVRLYRPFDGEALLAALPDSVQKIAVLDRTKEPGASGEPLYLDVQNAISEAVTEGRLDHKNAPVVVGGRYGLGSREFNPGMAKAVFDNLKAKKSKNHFTVGIHDDLADTSLEWDQSFSSLPEGTHQAMFYGLGGDGTVSANKNSIKIIGKETDNFAQGHFVYDSKKSGSLTISHLRFSSNPIHSTYEIDKAEFLACHAFQFLERYEIMTHLKKGGTFLLNSPYSKDEVWEQLPREVQEALIEKEAKFYVIDAYSLAKSLGLGARINVIMQAAFFKVSGVLPEDQAMEKMEVAVEDTYGDKGKAVVDMNIKAANLAVERIHKIEIPKKATSDIHMIPPVPKSAPEFVQEVTGEMIARRGGEIPVSLLPNDGTYPVGTTRYEKRNVATEIPVWDPEVCIQCNQCAFVCPHATIRPKVYDPSYTNGDSPEGWQFLEAKGRGFEDLVYTLQVAPEDCTGCGACVHICPAYAKDEQGNKTDHKAINMAPQAPIREQEAAKWDYFLSIPDPDPELFNRYTTKGSQFLRPLFEFSGACAGCGETPYVKLLTQLFGDRLIIANATGCSSIYGGNLPTTPYAPNDEGRGPAWSNSLFEDNAEFGMGMRLTVDKLTTYAYDMLSEGKWNGNSELVESIANAKFDTPEAYDKQRKRVEELKEELSKSKAAEAKRMLSVADYLTPKSVWIVGGDGWAYDIGYGGLDHVLASGRNVNVLVLDTGVYSNTGGQASKATPRGAVAKFAAAGKGMPKKDLGSIAMSYGNIYVAQVAYGANMTQLVKAMQEAEAYDGPSLIIAYSHCIAHGIDMTTATDLHEDAEQSGFWPLFRFNPDLAEQGKNPLQMDSKAPSEDIAEFAYKQNRFRSLRASDPDRAEKLIEALREDVITRWKFYEQMANLDL